MACYENEGFCPCNSFMNSALREFETTEEVEKMCDFACDRLRNIIPGMVYENGQVSSKGEYVTELLLTQGEFSREMIITLQTLLRKETAKVILKDVISLYAVDGDIVRENDCFKVGISEISDTTVKMAICKK